MPPILDKSPPLALKKDFSAAALNKLSHSDRAVHDWYRFILSYPPHLVREYLAKFNVESGDTVLDPFCGTGTTPVECMKHGVSSIGFEAHPMTHFAAQTKTNWNASPTRLRRAASVIAEEATRRIEAGGLLDDPQIRLLRELPALAALRVLPEETARLLLSASISPKPLHKVLILLDVIALHTTASISGPLRLALAKELVVSISNLHFGPEVGIGPAKEDAPVVSVWLNRVCQIADDLELSADLPHPSAVVHHADARRSAGLLAPKSIRAVITSPPYPNEKDYTRTTRLETVLLGFATTKAQMQALKKTMLMRSNTRNVYKGDDDDQWVAGHGEVQRIAREIEERRLQLGKTSGFERLYAKVTKLYFGGMARHLAELRPALQEGAKLAYVVGDQASYLRVMIRTGNILATIAESLGYEVQGIDLFRTRLATATREQLREEVLILKWPGPR